jgi:hypothetical protein
MKGVDAVDFQESPKIYIVVSTVMAIVSSLAIVGGVFLITKGLR